MPSYYYHLKFELYATPDPTATVSGSGADTNRSDIWVPSATSSIFDDLPSHPRSGGRSQPVTRRQRQRHEAKARDPGDGADAGVIDCGAPRAATAGGTDDKHTRNGNLEFLSERQWRARSRSSPPPKFSAGIGPRTAAKDWRCGRVSIESFDLAEGPSGGGGGHMMDNGKMAAAAKEEGVQPAASLGPNLGGMGQATKGRYVPLETKNTEAGWGIVHLFREADESSALRAVPGGVDDAVDEEDGDTSSDGDDGTILCIPAVPSYLSPGDFLGFIGEKWRGDVSHYRMVMTSRLSRYMVLMKFRDSRIAKQWRKEFDGKPFDSLEVRSSLDICRIVSC